VLVTERLPNNDKLPAVCVLTSTGQ